MTQFHFNFDPNAFNQFKTPRKPKMKPGKAHLTALVITLALAILIDYVTLPAWNLHSLSLIHIFRDVTANDFNRLLAETEIKTIVTTGKTAGRCYQKYAQPKTGIEATVLPSTCLLYTSSV